MLRCSKCKKVKDEAEFYKRPEVKKGLRKDCKECVKSLTKNNYFKNLPLSREKHKDDYHNRRRYLLIKAKYGMTREEFKEMSKLQNGKCAICNGKMKWYLHIDHDHITGKIRGLLCMDCNAGLGRFKDNVNFLGSAIKYLNKHNQ